MNKTIKYQIYFYSDWHCSSGQSTGFGANLVVIRDPHGLPFIPGKTLKGLLLDACKTFELLDAANDWHKFKEDVFGIGDDKKNDEEKSAEDEEFVKQVAKQSVCFFTNAQLPENTRTYLADAEVSRFLFREASSTAINKNGIAVDHSLRVMETVIPLTLEASIHKFPDEDDYIKKIDQCFKWVKRLGVNRNRGLGRCFWQQIPEHEKQAEGEVA